MDIESNTEQYHQISSPNDEEPPKDDKSNEEQSNDEEPPKDQTHEYEPLTNNKSASYENQEPANHDANNETVILKTEIPKTEPSNDDENNENENENKEPSNDDANNEESKTKSEPDTNTTNIQNETELTEKNNTETQPKSTENTDVTINISKADKNNEENIGSEVIQKRPTILRDGEMKFIANVFKCCDEMIDIDAYQVMAFDHNTKATWKDQFRYIFDIVKCILCALTQVFGILIIMAEVVKLGLVEKDWCNIPEVKDNNWSVLFLNANLKTLAFLFSSFLAYFSIDRLTSVKKGMYYKMKYTDKIKWVDSTWLKIGLFVNLFVSIIAVYGSFLVIFFSDNSLDMVLNSVALFFIVELDDLLVKTSDYERIKEHIEEYEDDHDAMVKAGMNKEDVGACKWCCHSFCGLFGRFLNWFVTMPFVIVQYITIVCCLIFPPFIVICY